MIKDIIIVGGGSAGWMTAAFLIKAYPEKNITLIESPDTPIVGVGESTIGGIRKYCSFLDIDEKDFLSHTNGSYKLSIKFRDFYDINCEPFHYPFGFPYIDGSFDGTTDWQVLKSLNPNIPISDFAESYFPAMALVNKNKFSKNENGEFNNFSTSRDIAYHFDATKFGIWLKDKYCIPRGVNHIINHINSVKVSNNGIEGIYGANRQKYTADLYIDCTGWQSLLLGKNLQEPFIDYSNILPNNKAWATQLPYKDKEKELEPFTNCTAISNGWVWNIPLWSRIGTGYVYSDKYIKDSDALEEFKKYLQSDKILIKREQCDIENLSFKNITMRVGIHERTWVKNVVAIGLSAGFIEPLESNGLFTIHEFLFKLGKILDKGSINQLDKDIYNFETNKIFDTFAQFVSMHYAMSIRKDTKYWQDATNKTYIKYLSSNNSYYNEIWQRKMGIDRGIIHNGMTWVSTGLNFHFTDRFDVHHSVHYSDMPIIEFIEKTTSRLNINKQRWNLAAENSPTLFNYLKNNIYINE